MATDHTLELFLRISVHRMCDQYLPKIRQCMGAINSRQLWEHGVHQTNSIGGILLHICEHVHRNTLQFQDERTVFASGIEDYFPDAGLSSEDLMHKVEDVFHAWKSTMQRLAAYEPSGVDVHSIYHLVEHTSYHLGQIVDRVQMTTGKAFKFVQNGLNERNLRELIEQDSLTN